MAYYAEIIDGHVGRVIVADSLAWCESRLGGTWIETQYDGSERGRYAGIGYGYDVESDKFYPPQPAYNYHRDTETASWTFPDNGDLIYIPARPAIAEPLSRGLYQLIVPGGDGLYAGLIPHPSGQAYTLLQCRQTDIIPVSLGANAQPLSDALEITVQDGALTQQELDGIVAAVQAMAGQAVSLVDFVPPSWQPYVMTRAQAEAAGYFPE